MFGLNYLNKRIAWLLCELKATAIVGPITSYTKVFARYRKRECRLSRERRFRRRRGKSGHATRRTVRVPEGTGLLLFSVHGRNTGLVFIARDHGITAPGKYVLRRKRLCQQAKNKNQNLSNNTRRFRNFQNKIIV